MSEIPSGLFPEAGKRKGRMLHWNEKWYSIESQEYGNHNPGWVVKDAYNTTFVVPIDDEGVDLEADDYGFTSEPYRGKHQN